MQYNEDVSEFENRRKAIQKKRLEKKRLRKKAALKKWLIFLSVVMVMTLAILSFTVFFPVKSIAVEGKTNYTAKEIISVSGIKAGQNLWMTGADAEENIVKKLPYISTITVKRKFPSKIIISVKAAEPTVCYDFKNEYYLCDKKNKLLEILKEKPENVTIITGGNVGETKVGNTVNYQKSETEEILKKLNLAFSDYSFNLDYIDVTDTVDIYLGIENRFDVTLGSVANLENKISHLAEMIEKIPKDSSGKIDLSVWTADNPKAIFTKG